MTGTGDRYGLRVTDQVTDIFATVTRLFAGQTPRVTEGDRYLPQPHTSACAHTGEDMGNQPPDRSPSVTRHGFGGAP